MQLLQRNVLSTVYSPIDIMNGNIYTCFSANSV